MQAQIDPDFDFDSYKKNKLADNLSSVDEEITVPTLSPETTTPAFDYQNYMPSSVYDSLHNDFGVKTNTDTEIAQEQQTLGDIEDSQAKLDETMATIYAMNYGQGGLNKANEANEQYIAKLHEQYGDALTKEDEQQIRLNDHKRLFQEARNLWSGSPVEVTNENLINLVTNTKIDAQALGTLGVYADIKKQNPMNTFSRSAELASLDAQLKEDFFQEKERSMEQTQNALSKAEALYSYEEDNALASTAGQLWDMTWGAAKRQYGGTLGALTMEGLSLLAAPLTGGYSLQLTNGYMFGKDMYEMTKRDVGFNAMVLDPSLTKEDVQHSATVNAASTGVALANVVGIGMMMRAGEKLLKVGKGLDAVAETFEKEGIESAANKLVYTNMLNSAKIMGVSEGVNIGVGSGTAFTQQLTTNIVGNNPNIWEHTADAATEGATMGAAFGLIPLPAATIRTVRDLHTLRKARISAANNLENKAATTSAEAILQTQTDADGTMNALHETEGFHELRTFVNIDEMQEWLKKNNREVSPEIREKIEKAEAEGLTEISFDPNEQMKMGNDYKSFFDELGKKEIDDMSPLEVAETLSEKEQAKADEAINATREMQDEIDRRMNEDSSYIAEQMYASMDTTDMPTRTRDAIVGMNDELFRSMSKLFGIPMRELWNELKFSWKNFDKTLYVDPNIERVEKRLRGNYSPEDGTIYLSHGADAATAVHEYGHFVLDSLFKLAKGRRANGKPMLELEGMLDEAFTDKWRTATDAELSAIHERFAYQFLDYILAGQRDGRKSTITPVMNTVKKLLITAERERAKKIDREAEFKGAKDARNLNRNEYAFTQGEMWVDRNSGFDGIANALFKADESMRRAEEDYSSERIDNYIQDAVIAKQLHDNHEAMLDIEQATREADAAREETQNLIESEMIKQSGYTFSFSDGFMKRWRELTHNSEAIAIFYKNSKVARELFRKYRDEIKAKIDNSTLGALYDQIAATKFHRDAALNDMVKHGLLSETDIKKLTQLGFIDENSRASVSDYFGKVEGTESNRIMREKQLADALHSMINFPTKQRLIYELTAQRVVKTIRDKAKLTAEHDGIRRSFLRMKERIAQSTARILSHLTHTPADRQSVISYAAKRIIGSVRLADLDEATFMRTAKNARRITERQVGKSEYEAAAKTNRAERVAITCANLIAKVRHGIDKAYQKNITLLRNDKYAAQNGYSNKYLDLARLIAHKQGIALDKKGITIEDLRKYGDEYPELAELIDRAEDMGLLKTDKPFLNHTVDEITQVYDFLSEIRTKAKRAVECDLEGVSKSMKENADAVKDNLAGRKYAHDTVDADGTVHKKGDLVRDKDGNIIEIPRTTKELTNRHGNATPEATGLKGVVAKGLDKIKAGLGRPSSWCEWMDGKTDGVISRMLYTPVAHASAAGEQAIKGCQKNINEVLTKVHWKAGVVTSPLVDKVTGKRMEFGNGQGIYGNAGYHIFGFMLHMGNEENWNKLLKAHDWSEKEVFGFIQQMIDEGYVTKDTLEALNKVWAMYDSHFEKANETFYKINGRHLRRVEARPIKIKVGDEVITLTGGYAPLIPDARRNGIKSKPVDFDSMKPQDYEKQLFEYEGVGGTPNHFKERTNSVFYVDFNPNRMLSVMPKVANYAAIMDNLSTVYNFWARKDVQSALKQYDPRAYNDVIKPFIMRAIKRSAVQSGDVFGSHLLNAVTNHVGMNLMFMNLANTVTQVSGVVNAMQRVGAYYLIKSFGARGKAFDDLRQWVCDTSPLMQSRIVESNSHLVESITHITSGAEGNTLFNKARAKWSHANNITSKYAYFMQKWLQDRIDVAVFKGAYDQEVAKLMPDFEAKYKGEVDDATYKELFKKEIGDHASRVAENAVIKTQSSSNMLDKSGFETSNAVNKMLFQFGNYFLTVMNMQVEEFNRLRRSNATMSEKAKCLALNFALGVVLPSYVAEAVMKTARGDWWNDDKDPDDMLVDLFVVQPVKTMISAMPYANGIGNAVIDMARGENYSGGLFNSPAVSSINSIGRTAARLFDGRFDGRTIRSVAMGIGLATGFAPATYMGKFAGNAYDLSTGNIRDDDMVDIFRTMITGSVRSDQRKN